jgi:ribonucleoside-diphosphate reductase alpha chain
MLSIDIRHPDVEKFINIKKDLSKVTGANISVLVRDDFMEAVKADQDYILRWPCDATFSIDSGIQIDKLEYNILTQGALGYYKKVKAKEVWNQIIEAAHGSAEPGIIFVDKHWDNSPDSVYPTYKGITTNP